jgi:hypothetical protein
MGKNHTHHITPRSLGGTDDPENLTILDFIEHAELHAREFLNGGIQFDFRHEGWEFLSKELRDACRAERSRRMKENQNGSDNPMFGKSRPDRKIAWQGDNNPNRQPEALPRLRKQWEDNLGPMFGEDNPFFGKTHTEETRRRLSEIHRANPTKPMEGKNHTEEAKEKMRGPREKMKGKLHWVNEEGKTQRRRECPGPGWQRGRKWRPQ